MSKVAHLVDGTTAALYRLTGDGTDGEPDLTGQGANAVHQGGDPLSRLAGRWNFARHFTGDGGGYLVGTLPDVFNGIPYWTNKTLTIEAVIRVPSSGFSSDPLTVGSVCAIDVDGHLRTFLQLEVDPTTRELKGGYTWGGGANWTSVVSTGYALPVSEWVHVAVSLNWNDGFGYWDLYLYANGVAVGFASSSDVPDEASEYEPDGLKVYIGATAYSDYTPDVFEFLGDIAEFALRADVRTEAQIAADAAGHVVSAAPVQLPPEPWTWVEPPDRGTVRDFGLNLDTMELQIGPDGDWVLVRDLDAIKQDAHTALGFIRGEWFLDLDEGFDVLGTVLVKSPSEDLIRAVVRLVMLRVRVITSVTRVDVELDRTRRAASVTWSAATDVGELRNQTTRVGA
jgi:hypothetical protein